MQLLFADASKAYNDAKGRLDAAKQRQADLTAQAQVTRDRLAALAPEVNAIAAAAYKGSRLSGLATLLDSGSPDDLLSRATTLQVQVDHDSRSLRDLSDAQNDFSETRPPR